MLILIHIQSDRSVLVLAQRSAVPEGPLVSMSKPSRGRLPLPKLSIGPEINR